MGDWTFFSNHGHVLVCLARDSDARLRDVAAQVGITERAVQKIVRDLQDEGYLEISKHGRRNRYRINNRKALRHPLQAGCTVGQLMGLLNKPTQTPKAAPAAESRAKPQVESQDEPRTEPQTESGAEPRTEPDAEPRPESEARPQPEEPPQAPDKDDQGSTSDLEQGQLF